MDRFVSEDGRLVVIVNQNKTIDVIFLSSMGKRHFRQLNGRIGKRGIMYSSPIPNGSIIEFTMLNVQTIGPGQGSLSVKLKDSISRWWSGQISLVA
jgi:hypothetical protein